MAGFDSSIIEEREKHNVVSKINNELKDFFRFIELLRKERSEKNKRLIDSFIKRESNALKRIAYIEELDREEFTSRPTTIDSSYLRVRGKVKKRKWVPINKVSFIRFLFSGKKELRSFASHTRVITLRFFMLGFRLTKESREVYKDILGGVTSFLLMPTVYILENKWDSLDRLRYNVINTFLKFIKRFSGSGNILKVNDISVVTSTIGSFIVPYLQIVSNEDYKGILISTFRSLLPYTKEKNRIEEIMRFLIDLVDISSSKLTFYNIVSGIYMINFRCIIKLVDFTNHYRVKKIDDSEYHFSKKVVQKIKDHLLTLELKYENGKKELFYMQFLENGFSFEYKGENHLTKLITAIYHYDIMGDFKTFEALKAANNIYGINFIRASIGNMTIIFTKLIKGFILFYGNFLTEPLYLKETNDKLYQNHTLFTSEVFIKEVNKLEDIYNELDRLKQRWSISISFDIYKKYITTNKIEVEKEKVMCDIYKMAIDTFYVISKKLGQLLYNNYLAHQLAVEEKISLNASNEAISYIEDKPKLIPFATHIISKHQYLDGQVVISTLGNIIIFCINICQLFQQSELNNRITQKKSYIDITEEYLKVKSQLD